MPLLAWGGIRRKWGWVGAGSFFGQRLSGGFGALPGRDEVPQEHVGISVYLADRQRGYIGIQVRMATEVWPQTRPESKKQASVEILVTYEPLAKFGRDLLSVVRGSLDEAVVPGETSL